MRTPRILVVEDDESLALVLRDALEREGYAPEVVADGTRALERALVGSYELILLDLMLPGTDGHEICRRVRAAGRDTQILVVTARGREEDRVKGLDLGADDYVVKPFSLRELMARVRARLRAGRPPLPEVVRLGDAEIDLAGMTIRRGGEILPLARLEAGVLELLLAHPGEVLTRNRFLDEVWGHDQFPTTRTVDMHIAKVREKLGDDGESFIRTVRGVGYRFDPPVEGLTQA